MFLFIFNYGEHNFWTAVSPKFYLRVKYLLAHFLHNKQLPATHVFHCIIAGDKRFHFLPLVC